MAFHDSTLHLVEPRLKFSVTISARRKSPLVLSFIYHSPPGSSDATAVRQNPLFDALDWYPNRAELYAGFLQCAMPWIAANLPKYLKETFPENQYVCLIGVNDAKVFEVHYGLELRSLTPKTP